ncbi:hypothetical protein DFH06DRAFT_1328255 [Mycena polygramma]|nr:hypothetical protein DFH06DRAFT_1328255 [Mycena polygramma]
MFFPALLRLRETVTDKLGRLPSEGVPPEEAAYHITCAQVTILDTQLQPTWDLFRDCGSGKPHFALAVTIALQRVLPEVYHTRTYLLGLLDVFMAESSLIMLSDFLQTTLERDDFSRGPLLLFIFGSLLSQNWRDRNIVQSVVDAVLEPVFEEGIKEEATTFHNCLARRISKPSVVRHPTFPRVWSIRGPQHSKIRSGCFWRTSGNPPWVSHDLTSSNSSVDRASTRRTRAAPKAKVALARSQEMGRARTNVHGMRLSFHPFLTTLSGPLPVPSPKSRGAYPNSLGAEIQLALDALLLASPANLYNRHFYIKVPPICHADWQSIPVADTKKCEGLLVIGRYILEASLTALVYQERFEAPLTCELVLAALLSDHTLRTVLMQAGVFHEPETVPAHFPARAFKIYLGAVLVTETLPFSGIDSWLGHIFQPIARWLKLYGLGDYHANRAALAAAGIKVAEQ